MIGSDQFRWEAQHQRRFEFAGMPLIRDCVDEVGDVGLIEVVHRLERWARGYLGVSLEMGLELMRRGNQDVVHPVVVAGIPSCSYCAGERRGTQDAERFAGLLGPSLGSEVIRLQRKLWTMLLQGASREDQARIRGEDLVRSCPWHLVDRL